MSDEKPKREPPTMDDVLRRMLATPPDPHKKSPSAKKRPKKPAKK
jgi:hypothetical protein